MELCSGGELFQKIKNSPMVEAQAAKVMYQCLSAVRYLHAKNISHRDLKPENIMFLDDLNDEIKIIDFGLSKRVATG